MIVRILWADRIYLLSILFFVFRDISLTDFKGSYVAVFFCASDFENHDDLTILNQHLKVFKKQSCDVVACSTDSTMLHSKWIQSLKDEDEGTKAEDFHIPLMSDKTGELRISN